VEVVGLSGSIIRTAAFCLGVSSRPRRCSTQEEVLAAWMRRSSLSRVGRKIAGFVVRVPFITRPPPSRNTVLSASLVSGRPSTRRLIFAIRE
jgi:hypothetical protein